jgi:hypothetical protein
VFSLEQALFDQGGQVGVADADLAGLLRDSGMRESLFERSHVGQRLYLGTSSIKPASKGEVLSLLQARASGSGRFKSTTDMMTTLLDTANVPFRGKHSVRSACR